MKVNLKSLLLIINFFFGITLLAACAGAKEEKESWPETFKLGRTPSIAEIAAMDKDVSRDGKGLPPGSGNAIKGRIIFQSKCALCHGATGSEGPFDKLVSTVLQPQAKKEDTPIPKTIGNYWPYSSTIYDYIQRAMPYTKPGSLTPDEVYSLTAFLLSQNKLIDSLTVMDAQSLPLVVMPAQKLYVPDDRRGGHEVR
jgi:S-disulfanyl-L-cysteine oxidoreductase SoxD